MTAVFVNALMATPQLWHDPPEKLAKPLELLVSVLVMVAPLIRNTPVPLSTQTVSPVTELEEHELTSVGVDIAAGVSVPSIGTLETPVVPELHEPLGT